MALGILGLFFISILFISIITIITTLFSKNLTVIHTGFIVTLVLTGIIIFLTITNYMTSQLVGLLPGIPALAAILMSFQNKEYGVSRAARIVACIGLASSVYCFIFL